MTISNDIQSIAISILLILMASTSFLSSADAKTPYEIIAQAPASDWRDIDPENSLYISLTSGTVVVEMAPQFAPKHVENTKMLVREGLFNNTSFYRVIDGFVAQGGPTELADKDKPKKGQLTIDAEFTLVVDKPLNITPLAAFDGYAHEVGYIDEFAIGRSKDKKDNWLLHCYGAFAMGRANEANSGGTELYVVIGSAQRYLDRNTTVFGRVVAGMEHLQALQRSTTLKGNIDVADKNKIIKIIVGSDLKQADRMPLQVMKTNSASFKQLIESRKNRNGQWFLYQHNYIDVCSVAIPVRLANGTHP